MRRVKVFSRGTIRGLSRLLRRRRTLFRRRFPLDRRDEALRYLKDKSIHSALPSLSSAPTVRSAHMSKTARGGLWKPRTVCFAGEIALQEQDGPHSLVWILPCTSVHGMGSREPMKDIGLESSTGLILTNPMSIQYSRMF